MALSSADIDKGARWSTDVAVRLQAAKAGIICVTPSNLHSDWVLFEAGALSKTLLNTFVCPFLIGLEPTDVKGPLAQFQATRTTKDDVLRLLKTLNTGLGESGLPDAHIEEAFEVWWPKLETELKKVPPDDATTRPHRADRDILEEILGLVRSQNRPVAALPAEVDEENAKRLAVQRKVFLAITKADPSINRMSVRSVSPDYSFVAMEKGERANARNYPIVVPADMPMEGIDDCVRAQIPTDRLRQRRVTSDSETEAD